MQANDLALAHDDTARELGQVFADDDLGQQALEFAETPLFARPLGIVRHLPNAFDIGGDPGQAVGDVLLALQDGIIDFAIRRNLGFHGLGGSGAEGFGRVGGGIKERDQSVGHGFGGGQRLHPQKACEIEFRTTKPERRRESNANFSHSGHQRTPGRPRET